MKNFVRDGQKLPLFGIGPFLVYGMAALTLLGIVLSGNVLKAGRLSGGPAVAFRVAGVALILLGVAIWLIGALRSDMDEYIASNRLKTDGIYAWVRNPMYVGWWLLIAGISFQWRNACLALIPFINWGLMTLVLKRTEEKWLLKLYGQAYAGYMKRVNRCIPWPPRK